MSLNAIISQDHLTDLAVLNTLVEEFLGAWQLSGSQEERFLVEQEVIALFESIMNGMPQMRDVAPGSNLEIHDNEEFYNNTSRWIRANSAKINLLRNQMDKYIASHDTLFTQLAGQMRRIKQKSAALSLWDREIIKYVVAESFTNYDQISSRFSSSKLLVISPDEGVATLASTKTDNVPVRSVVLGKDSNGYPGNSDAAVNLNVQNPKYLFDGDDNTWFEYERLDEGPLRMTLVFELSSPDIINKINILPVVDDSGNGFVIEDITFSLDGVNYLSIDRLRNFENKKQTLAVTDSINTWSLTFLPVKAKNIAIKFLQSNSVSVFTGVNRLRARYLIGLKKVSFQKISYASEGSISSTERTFSKGCYALQPVSIITPSNNDFYTSRLDVSFDGGSTWQDTTSTVILDGSESSLHWKLNIVRNEQAFSQLAAFEKPMVVHGNVSTMLRTISRKNSPATLLLQGKPESGTIGVMQPKVMRVGHHTEAYPVSSGSQSNGVIVRLQLPVDVYSLGIWDTTDMYFVYNSIPTPIGEPSYGESTVGSPSSWFLDEDGRSVVLSGNFGQVVNGGTVVGSSQVYITGTQSAYTFGFFPETLKLEERDDGYYHYIKPSFDPDQKTQKLTYFAGDSKQYMDMLPAGVRKLRLKANNIDPDSVSAVGADGTEYSVAAKLSDVSGSIDFYVNTIQGTVRVYDTVSISQPVVIRYKAAPVSIMDNQYLSTFFENSKPVGVRVDKAALPAAYHTETIGDAQKITIALDGDDAYSFYAYSNIFSPRYVQRKGYVSDSKVRMLSHSCVIKNSVVVSDNLLSSVIPPEEVEYVDGYSEFSGVKQMQDEATISIQSGVNTYVTFYLACRELLDTTFKVLFDDTSVFDTDVGSVGAVTSGGVGDYCVLPTGQVTVNIGTGATLKSNIAISYFYRDPSFDGANKYSIDYARGVIYSSATLNEEATITYKTMYGNLSYDIVLPCVDWSFDSNKKTVTLNTEIFSKVNDLAKVYWLEETKVKDFNQLRNYFSPVIDAIQLRFS
jgi:hypothetical protein